MDLRFFFDNLWRWKCNLPEKPQPLIGNIPDLDTLNQTQYTEEFQELHEHAHRRMVMGVFRYGDINRQNLQFYDTVLDAHKRLNRYSADHNLEHLVDAYNMIRIEYFKARRRGEQLIPIDDGEHAIMKET